MNRFIKYSLLFFLITFSCLSVETGFANSTDNKDHSIKLSPTERKLLKDLNADLTYYFDTRELTYYFDTREYNTLNFVTGLSNLPGAIKLWGFVDLSGKQRSGNDRFDITRYFLEYRLSKSIFPSSHRIIKNIRFEVEHNDSNGPDNDVLRLGLTFKHSIPFLAEKNSWLQWRYHPYETDGTGSQVSVIYFLTLTERIFINGFADLNLENGADDRWVVEPQINFVLTDSLDLVLEPRYNEFEDANKTVDGFGIAGGFKIKF